MRGSKAIVAAALALSLIPGVAAASEERPTGLTFSPALAGPGDLVTVSTSACGPAASAVVYPKSLAAPAMLAPAVEPGRAEGTIRILSSAEPGTYTIPAVCADGTQVNGVLKVPRSWIG